MVDTERQRDAEERVVKFLSGESTPQTSLEISRGIRVELLFLRKFVLRSMLARRVLTKHGQTRNTRYSLASRREERAFPADHIRSWSYTKVPGSAMEVMMRLVEVGGVVSGLTEFIKVVRPGASELKGRAILDAMIAAGVMEVYKSGWALTATCNRFVDVPERR